MNRRVLNKIICSLFLWGIVCSLAQNLEAESTQEAVRLHYDRGRDCYCEEKYQEAKNEFQQVLNLEPQHQGAQWYLEHVEKELAQIEADKSICTLIKQAQGDLEQKKLEIKQDKLNKHDQALENKFKRELEQIEEKINSYKTELQSYQPKIEQLENIGGRLADKESELDSKIKLCQAKIEELEKAKAARQESLAPVSEPKEKIVSAENADSKLFQMQMQINEQLLAEVSQFKKEKAEPFYTQARQYLKKKDFQQARESLQKALSIYPDYAEAKKALASIQKYEKTKLELSKGIYYFGEEDYLQAKQAFEQALNLDYKNQQARDYLKQIDKKVAEKIEKELQIKRQEQARLEKEKQLKAQEEARLERLKAEEEKKLARLKAEEEKKLACQQAEEKRRKQARLKKEQELKAREEKLAKLKAEKEEGAAERKAEAEEKLAKLKADQEERLRLKQEAEQKRREDELLAAETKAHCQAIERAQQELAQLKALKAKEQGLARIKAEKQKEQRQRLAIEQKRQEEARIEKERLYQLRLEQKRQEFTLRKAELQLQAEKLRLEKEEKEKLRAQERLERKNQAKEKALASARQELEKEARLKAEQERQSLEQAKKLKAEEELQKKIDTHYLQGRKHFEQQDYIAAAKEFKDILSLDPKNKYALNALEKVETTVKEEEKERQRQEKQEQEAQLNSRQERLNQFLAQGKVYFYKEQYQEALDEFGKLLVEQPDNPKAEQYIQQCRLKIDEQKRLQQKRLEEERLHKDRQEKLAKLKAEKEEKLAKLKAERKECLLKKRLLLQKRCEQAKLQQDEARLKQERERKAQQEEQLLLKRQAEEKKQKEEILAREKKAQDEALKRAQRTLVRKPKQRLAVQDKPLPPQDENQQQQLLEKVKEQQAQEELKLSRLKMEEEQKRLVREREERQREQAQLHEVRMQELELAKQQRRLTVEETRLKLNLEKIRLKREEEATRREQARLKRDEELKDSEEKLAKFKAEEAEALRLKREAEATRREQARLKRDEERKAREEKLAELQADREDRLMLRREIRLHLVQGRVHYYQKQYEQAIEEFKQALLLSSDGRDIERYIIKCQKGIDGRGQKAQAAQKAKAGKLEQAAGLITEEKEEEKLEKIQELYEKGRNYFRRGLYSDAIACFEKVIELEGNPRIHYTPQAEDYIERSKDGIKDQAEEIAAEEVERQKLSVQERSQAEGQAEDEVQRRQEAEIRRHYNLGKKYYRQKNYPLAIAELNKVREIDPNHAYANYAERFLARCRQEIIEQEEAGLKAEMKRGLKDIQQGKTGEKVSSETLYAQAKWYYQRGDYEQVAKICKAALELDPLNKSARSLLFAAEQKQIKKDKKLALKELAIDEKAMMAEVAELQVLPDEETIYLPEKEIKPIVKLPAIREKLKSPITVDFRDVDLSYVLNFLADSTGVNIVPASGVSLEGKKVSIKMKDIPAENALKYILKNQGLSYRIEENVVWVASPSEMEKEEVESRVYFLNYGSGMFTEFERTVAAGTGLGGASAVSKITTLKDILEKAVDWPKNSKLVLDERSGALVIANTPANLQVIEDVLYNLDITPMQVLIEARFVELEVTDTEELGIEWKNTAVLGDKRVEGANVTQWEADSGLGFTDFTRATEGLNLTYTGVLTYPEFQTVLHALSETRDAKTLSAPRITTLNNQMATIKVVDEWIYPTRYEFQVVQSDANGDGDFADANETTYKNVPVDFVTKDVGILLHVTPNIGADGKTITLALVPEVSEGTAGYFSYTGSISLPKFTSRTLSTSVVVNNGETVALGGLVKESTTKTITKVPILGDIPILGQLFRKKSDSVIRKNLLIFVTASIISPSGEKVEIVQQR